MRSVQDAKTTSNGVLMSAIFSADGRYRYVLNKPTTQPSLFPPRSIALWILHNPSIADGVNVKDATSSRVNGFSGAYETWVIINPWAYVATDKDELLKVNDPVGPENDAHIRTQLARARTAPGSRLICGWGNVAPRLQRRVDAVLKLIRCSGVTPMCLGHNKNGSPKHPLYLGGTELVPL